MNRSLPLVPVLMGLVLGAFPVALWAQCPGCYYNTGLMAGHGPAPDGSPRRVINIYIDSSWGNPTNTNLWNGIEAACADWNKATDQNGKTTGYYFQINQGSSQQADIVVSRNDSLANLNPPPWGADLCDGLP